MKHLSLALLALLCACFAAGAAETAKLPVMEITVSDPITPTMDYSKGSMKLTDVDGSVVELKAKFCTRGATAKQYTMKPSLNMKLRTDDYAASRDSSLLGIRSISSYILDAMAIDRICMRNRVAMDLWNAYSPLPYESDFNGRSGTEGRFVELYINGDLYGIYCLSDKINRKLLNLKKYDEAKGKVRGVLYKSGTEDIENQNERNFTDDFKAATVAWHDAWELKEPEDFECREAWQPLLDAYDGIKTYDDVCRYFFVDNLVDHQLLVMALGIVDNWGNKNHYFSIRNIQKDIDDPDPTEAERRKFVLSPWDLDTSLGGDYNGTKYDGDYVDWPLEAVASNGGFFPYPLCQGQTDYKTRMKERWQQLRQGALSPDSVMTRMKGYADLFVGSGAWKRMTDAFDARDSKPQMVYDLDKEVELVGQWYRDRCAMMDSYFDLNAIEGIGADTQSLDNSYYNLMGLRFNSRPTQPGVYLHQGKKIVVK